MILDFFFFFFAFPKIWVGRRMGNETFYGNGLIDIRSNNNLPSSVLLATSSPGLFPTHFLREKPWGRGCSPWMVSRFTATMDWSTVWVSSDQKPLAVTDKSPGNPLNKTITLPNCATLRHTNSTDTLLACSRRSDNAVRREAREWEKK